MDSNNIFYQYLQSHLTFQTFGTSHIIVLIVTLLLCISLPLLAKKYASLEKQLLIGKAIGWIIIMSLIGAVLLEIAAGTFDFRVHLPLQICYLSNLFILSVLQYRSFKWFEIMYFWVFSVTLQATLTPDLSHNFPHFGFFRFFIGHSGLILAIVYAIVVYEMRPNKHSIWKAALATNVYLFAVSAINYLIHSNYFYTCAKPLNPSLLDSLGEWPWYIVKGEFIMIVFYGIIFLPFAFSREKRV
ncbi:MAG: TIGR02206 family membrane protein [Bacteroidia bacterium]|nr:TIGR02206 family membrane protein [Bacteroidia bacterium]